ncbi:hypothetical protein [Myxococcus sp. SDU36]|uniref:hypothetical protein n=1 Tax=Myxococcus sp. SDU36 TaxID=2831967 RepID=UPI0025429603|nr:hypothetical protein [Myxococcus sp. SDU36]
MSERIVALYRFGVSEQVVTGLRGVLHRAGASLARPQDGRTFIIDAEGEQIPSPETSLLRLLREQREVAFQWWLGAQEDIYCRVRVMGEVIVVEFGLEGTSPQDRALVGEVLLEYVRNEREHVIAFIYDPEGVTEDRDWDDHFVRGEIIDWRHSDVGFPDVLVVRETIQFRLKNAPRNVERVADDGLVVMTWRPSGA